MDHFVLLIGTADRLTTRISISVLAKTTTILVWKKRSEATGLRTLCLLKFDGRNVAVHKSGDFESTNNNWLSKDGKGMLRLQARDIARYEGYTLSPPTAALLRDKNELENTAIFPVVRENTFSFYCLCRSLLKLWFLCINNQKLCQLHMPWFH